MFFFLQFKDLMLKIDREEDLDTDDEDQNKNKNMNHQLEPRMASRSQRLQHADVSVVVFFITRISYKRR